MQDLLALPQKAVRGFLQSMLRNAAILKVNLAQHSL